MSTFSYNRTKEKLIHEFQEKRIELKGTKHYDRFDIENEREKRWIYSLCAFFAGLIVQYFLMK